MKTILVCTSLVCLLGGCAQRTRHRIPTFFFDGIPPLEEERPDRQDKGIPDPGVEEPEKQLQGPATPVVYRRGPFDSGSCGSCHDTRASNRLLKDGNDLCLTCHAGTFTGKKTIHVPALASCLICHDPHKSDNDALLDFR